MTKFGYPLLARIIYRHVNLILTPVLLAYVIISFGGIFTDSKYWIPFIVNLLLLIVFNRFYFRMYKYFPFEIEADEEKIICTNFMNRRKKVEIKFSDITKIEGGVFSGSAIKPIYIYEASNGNVIGINPHLTDFSKFVTLLLTKIDRQLYESLLTRMEKLGEAALEMRNKKKNKKARK